MVSEIPFRGVMGMIPLCATPTSVVDLSFFSAPSDSVIGKGCVFSGSVPPWVVMRKCMTTGVAVRSRRAPTFSKAFMKFLYFIKPFSIRTAPFSTYMKPAPSLLTFHMVRRVSLSGIATPAGLAAIMHILVILLNFVLGKWLPTTPSKEGVSAGCRPALIRWGTGGLQAV